MDCERRMVCWFKEFITRGVDLGGSCFFYINHLGTTLRVRDGTIGMRWGVYCIRQYMIGKTKLELSQFVKILFTLPRRTMEPLWGWGASIALLLLPLKSRSGGADHLRFLRTYTDLIWSHSY